MTLGAGALSLKRFQILTKKPPYTWDEAATKFKKARIDPLDLEDAREETSGFCHPFTGEPTAPKKQSIALLEGENLLIGFRVDTKKIPGTLFRLQLKAALEGLENAKGTFSEDGEEKPKRAIQKKFRDAAKERIKEELLKRTLPNIKLLEVLWNLQSGEIWVTSTTDSLLLKFQAEFEQVFEVQLMEYTPGIAALNMEKILRSGANLNAANLEMQKISELAPAAFCKLSGRNIGKLKEEIGIVKEKSLEMSPF